MESKDIGFRKAEFVAKTQFLSIKLNLLGRLLRAREFRLETKKNLNITFYKCLNITLYTCLNITLYTYLNITLYKCLVEKESHNETI